jgi:hypothetical protein
VQSSEIADGVETCRGESEIIRHGGLKALAESGVPVKRLPTGVYSVRTGSARKWCAVLRTIKPVPWWACRRQPDGTFVYREETPGAFAERFERFERDTERFRTSAAELAPATYRLKAPLTTAPPKPFLRLVVDNT